MATITDLQGSTPVTTAGAAAIINNNFDNLNSDKIETSYLDTDTTLGSNSDTKIATQKAVKAYVDSGGNQNASETQRGIVEEATDAEVTAGTATGATGAKLFVTPAKLSTRISNFTAPVVRTYLNSGSPHTWTKPAGLKYAVVEVQAAGGSGGGASVGSSNSASGGGGGAGGYSKKLIAAGSLGATETVTVGVSGSSSSFGSHASANSGENGVDEGVGGLGGTASSGDLNLTGGDGGSGVVEVSVRAVSGPSGGSSVLGGGGRGGRGTGSSGQNGTAGKNYGGGGGGGCADNNNSATGGAGGAAIVIVTEYYV